MTSKKIIFAIGAICIVVILFSIAVIFKEEPQSLKKNNGTDKLSLQVSYQFFNKDYTAPIVIIKNKNNKKWEDCEIKINDQYAAKIEELPIISSENDIRTIPITDFIRSDGVKFNYSANVPKSACISCNKPNYSIYCGKFGYASK